MIKDNLGKTTFKPCIILDGETETNLFRTGSIQMCNIFRHAITMLVTKYFDSASQSIFILFIITDGIKALLFFRFTNLIKYKNNYPASPWNTIIHRWYNIPMIQPYDGFSHLYENWQVTFVVREKNTLITREKILT